MTQDQYIRVAPLRHYIDQYHAVGNIAINSNDLATLQQVHQELFGGQFNGWCQNCVIEAVTKIMVEHDRYKEASAPVIVSVGQQAKVKTSRAKRK